METIYSRLRAWRSIQARELNLPAYCVISNAHLQGVAAACPTTLEQLAACKGLGQKRLERYGDALLDQVTMGLADGLEPGVVAPEPVGTVDESENLTAHEIDTIAEALRMELARQVARRLKGRFTLEQVNAAMRWLSPPA